MVFSSQILGRTRPALYQYGLAAAVLALSALAGCGQKGPLFIAPQTVPFRLLPESSNAAPPSAPVPLKPASAPL